jgi:hypothetical protein
MNTSPTVTRKDRTDLWSTIVVAAIAAVVTVTVTVIRMLDLFSVDGITATARLDGVPADLPIGPGGAAVSGRLHEISFTATEIPGLSAGSYAAAIIFTGLAYLVVIGCVLRFCINLMRGESFTRQNTRLIWAAAITILAGTALTAFCNTMGVNGAFASIGDWTVEPDTSVTHEYWVAMFACITLGAVAVAFRAGERLRRDTEGLV